VAESYRPQFYWKGFSLRRNDGVALFHLGRGCACELADPDAESKKYENFLLPIAGRRGVRDGRRLVRVREQQRIKAKQD
jgi:hypothetical protein